MTSSAEYSSAGAKWEAVNEVADGVTVKKEVNRLAPQLLNSILEYSLPLCRKVSSSENM